MEIMEIAQELEKITSFLEIANSIKCEPYCSYPIIYKTACYNKDEILILDEDCDVVYNVKTFEEFCTFYIRKLIKYSYERGQDNLRKAIKDIIGLTV